MSKLFEHLPGVQVVLSAAILYEGILDISKKYMRNPVKFIIKRDEPILDGADSES